MSNGFDPDFRGAPVTLGTSALSPPGPAALAAPPLSPPTFGTALDVSVAPITGLLPAPGSPPPLPIELSAPSSARAPSFPAAAPLPPPRIGELPPLPPSSLPPVPTVLDVPMPPELLQQAAPATTTAELGQILPPPVLPGQPPIAPPPLLDAALSEVAGLSNRAEELRDLQRSRLQALGAETDPKKRQEIESQLLDGQAALQDTQSNLAGAREVADEEQIIESQRTENELRAAQREAQLRIRRDTLDRAEQGRLADAALAKQEDAARAEQREASERHAEIAGAGPQRNIIATGSTMITEALRAFNEDRPPNFARALDTLLQQEEQQWKREAEAAGARVRLLGDDVADIGRQRQERKIQEATAAAAYADRVLLDLDQRIATAQTDKDRQIAIAARDGLRRERDQRIAEAEAERVARARKEAREGLADELTRARIGKERAAAAKAEAEAAKLARRGTGRRAAKAAVLATFPPELRALAATGKEGKRQADFIFPRLVIDPVTGESTKRADGSFAIATSPAIAQELNTAGTTLARINGLVNEATAIRGAEGWEPTSQWFSSKAGKRMAAISTELLLANKELFGLGVLNESDVPILERIQGGNLAGMQDPRPVLQDMRRRMVKLYNSKRQTSAPGSQPITFPAVTAPPRRTAQNLTTLLTQAPGADGDIPGSGERLPALDELFETFVGEHEGNIERASADFERRGAEIRKRGEAHRDTLRSDLDAALPSNWDDLRGEQGAAFVQLAAAKNNPDATGEQLNEAQLRFDQANRDAENALSKRAKRLRRSLEEQEQFLEGLGRKLRGESKRRAEFEQLQRSRVRGAERAGEAFEAGAVPTGARGAF